jgi:hypothetical protein
MITNQHDLIVCKSPTLKSFYQKNQEKMAFCQESWDMGVHNNFFM